MLYFCTALCPIIDSCYPPLYAIGYPHLLSRTCCVYSSVSTTSEEWSIRAPAAVLGSSFSLLPSLQFIPLGEVSRSTKPGKSLEKVIVLENRNKELDLKTEKIENTTVWSSEIDSVQCPTFCYFRMETWSVALAQLSNATATISKIPNS